MRRAKRAAGDFLGICLPKIAILRVNPDSAPQKEGGVFRVPKWSKKTPLRVGTPKPMRFGWKGGFLLGNMWYLVYRNPVIGITP